jgi:hypothetical protein
VFHKYRSEFLWAEEQGLLVRPAALVLFTKKTFPQVKHRDHNPQETRILPGCANCCYSRLRSGGRVPGDKLGCLPTFPPTLSHLTQALRSPRVLLSMMGTQEDSFGGPFESHRLS